MRARSLLLVAVLVVGLGWSAFSAPSVVSASGGIWFYIPPFGPIGAEFPDGLDVQMSFNAQGLWEFGVGTDRGHVHLRLFDAGTGKLVAVLKATQKIWPTGKTSPIWGTVVDGDGIRFWAQLDVKRGSVPDMLLWPWTWWVTESGGGYVMLHGLGPWDITKGNVKIHGL